MIPYLAAVALFAVGVHAVASRRDRHGVIVGMGLIHFAAGLAFVLAGWRTEGETPIVTPESWEAASRAVASGAEAGSIHDPAAQAMAALVIMVGMAATVLAAAIHSRLRALPEGHGNGPDGEGGP